VDKFKHGELEMSSVRMGPGDFFLASSVERIKMPTNMIGFIKDKSSWAREGLCVQNTVLEPGWEGWITLELSFHRNHHSVTIESGDPIAQIIFQWLDKPTENPYTGKYQNQEGRPVEAIAES
jgi:dCTP deaminase